jgi:hypothetical protein
MIETYQASNKLWLQSGIPIRHERRSSDRDESPSGQCHNCTLLETIRLLPANLLVAAIGGDGTSTYKPAPFKFVSSESCIVIELFKYAECLLGQRLG